MTENIEMVKTIVTTSGLRGLSDKWTFEISDEVVDLTDWASLERELAAMFQSELQKEYNISEDGSVIDLEQSPTPLGCSPNED